MFAPIAPDPLVLDPAILGLGIAAMFGFAMLVVLIEAAVLRGLKWGRFSRSFLASLLMNAASSVLGGILLIQIASLLPSPENRPAPFISPLRALVLLSFAVGVVIEAGLLMLMKRGAMRQNWMAALLANVASYALVIIPLGLLASF